MYKVEIFTDQLEYASACMIDDVDIELDYLAYDSYTITTPSKTCQKGYFVHITDEDNNYIADGIVGDVQPNDTMQDIQIRPLQTLFDSEVFYTPVSDCITWLATNIDEAYMHNTDTLQNRPIALTYTTTTENLPLTGFNLHETVNILSVMISALKTYGVVVDSRLNLTEKKFEVNIYQQDATKVLEASLDNVLDKSVTIGDSYGSTNKAVIRKTQVVDDSTTVLGQTEFYLHPDGSIDTDNTNRIIPVFYEIESLELDDDMTEADWQASALSKAKEILTPAKYDNEIDLTYGIDDQLAHPMELAIGTATTIYLEGETYSSILTGKRIHGKEVTLIFGVTRAELSKKLSMEKRETMTFENTVSAVMANVAENYVSNTSGTAPNARRLLDYNNGDVATTVNYTDYNANNKKGGAFVSYTQSTTEGNPPANGAVITLPSLHSSGNWTSQIASPDNPNAYSLYWRARSDQGWQEWRNIWTQASFNKATGYAGPWVDTAPMSRHCAYGTKASNLWLRLCHISLKESVQGHTIWMRILLSAGQNGTTNQIQFADLFLMQGWQGSSNGRLGGNYIYYPLSTGKTTLSIKVISTNAGTNPELEYDVWIQQNSSYFGHGYVVSADGRYVKGITYSGTTQSTAPTGTACNVQGGRIAYTTF